MDLLPSAVMRRSERERTPHRYRLSKQPPAGRHALAAHATPRLGPALFDLATSVVAYLAVTAAMFVAMRVSYLLVLALAIPAAGFLIRTFIVFHDCAHGSFCRSKRANAMLGAVLGVVLYMPFAWWRHKHAVHHATTGDLDRRGVGDIQTLTVEEYRARAVVGPPRLPALPQPVRDVRARAALGRARSGRGSSRRGMHPRLRRSVLAHRPRARRGHRRARLARRLAGRSCSCRRPPLLLTGAAGIWLFYVQHQFEDAYWQRATSGASTRQRSRAARTSKLPRVLRFFTGNIGLHHVHHLSARIPNYNLQAAHEAVRRSGRCRPCRSWTACVPFG